MTSAHSTSLDSAMPALAVGESRTFTVGADAFTLSRLADRHDGRPNYELRHADYPQADDSCLRVPSAFDTGARVTYRGHAAVVMHPSGVTANIRMTPEVRGMSAQLDVWTSELAAAQ